MSRSKTTTATSRWTASGIQSLENRSAVITGTGGLGLQAALELARAGAEVIVAGRNPSKGEEAISTILQQVPSANVRFEQLDLASLWSVEDFTTRLRHQRTSLDMLINNAAVMMPPKRLDTVDGLELQFGTNYLGHFALTARLMPLLSKGNDPRVVTLSSIAAREGSIRFSDLQSERNYNPMAAYAQSKLACLIFALELQRRSEAHHWGISSIAAHPGLSRTDLLHNGPGRASIHGLLRTFLWFLFQPVARGALPILFAATSAGARGGGYYGPAGFGETRGAPADAAIPAQALDIDTTSRLWEISGRLAGASFPDAC